MSNLSVLDMVDQYAKDNDIDQTDVFKKKPKEEKVEEPVDLLDESVEEEAEPVEEKPVTKKKKEWKPDVSDMPEFQQAGVVYEKDEIKYEEEGLADIADEMLLESSAGEMADLKRKEQNIEAAKKRHGIKKLQIPPGEMQVRFLLAAGNDNFKEAQKDLDILLEEVKKLYPAMILEYEDGHVENAPTQEPVQQTVEQHVQETPVENAPVETNVEPPIQKVDPSEIKMADGSNIDDLKIVIDKRDASNFTWDKEEIEKIKKSRTVELNIVEGKDIEFGSVNNVYGNAVDKLLAKYQRKANDIVAVLPASKYRATFTGLTFPEVLDLTTSNELNNVDGEWKKWSMCFTHIRNQSIGAWEEYSEYIDPETNAIVRMTVGSQAPEGIDPSTVHVVTKFEDFMRKTSYLDLEFMLWKILCATTMDKEVISIDCKSIHNGQPCNNTYEWIYSPSELLNPESINVGVLEDMKKTGEAASEEDIMNNYETSPVRSRDYVRLNTSGFIVIYGHVSANTYLNDLYSNIKRLEEESNQESIDPSIVSESMKYAALTTIKEILIPDDNGNYNRVSDVNDLIKILGVLDEIDWQTITKITELMTTPYQFKYSMRDIVCPKCKNKSTIAISSMADLLFIVARSLSSVQVTLKKN